MIGSTLYMVGLNVSDGSYVENTCSCAMCKRLIINAGISNVVIRDTKDTYRDISVREWILSDESLDGESEY